MNHKCDTVEFCLRAAESELAAGRIAARDLHDANIEAAFEVARTRVRQAHRAIEALQAMLSENGRL
jgi:hypothetical protein